MRKAYLVGLVAAGSLALGATASSAATANAAMTSSSFTTDAGAYPAPAGATFQKKRGMDGALPWLLALGVGGGALFVALDDNGSPDSP